MQTAAAFRVRRECSLPAAGPAQLLAAHPNPNPRIQSFTQAGEEKRAEIEVLGGEEVPTSRADSGATDEVAIIDTGDDAVPAKKKRRAVHIPVLSPAIRVFFIDFRKSKKTSKTS